jgi:hypothetical protein
LFGARRIQLAHWATHHRVPATYSGRQYVEAGGLMSYGASLTDASRQMGVYAGLPVIGFLSSALPGLLDPTGKVGHAYGARTTPHMYVINGEGALVYKGGIDDQPTARLQDLKSAKNFVDQICG